MRLSTLPLGKVKFPSLLLDNVTMMYHGNAMQLTKGSAALTAMCEGRGAQASIAAKLNVKPPLIIRWRRGDVKPDAANRAALEDELGIPWRAWDEAVDSGAKGAA